MTEKELLNEQPKKLFKLSKLLNEGIITLDDVADIVPGIMHVNSRENLAIDYISKTGQDLIRYSQEELNILGSEVLLKHQSEFTIKNTYPKLFKELEKDDINHTIPFFQDWYFNKKEKPTFYFTTTKILNEKQTISISLFPQRTKCLKDKVNNIFGINTIFEKYFSRYRLLTKREKEILQLLGKELTRKEIAYTLFISEPTVKKHCESIFKKLHTSKRTKLEKIALAFSTL